VLIVIGSIVDGSRRSGVKKATSYARDLTMRARGDASKILSERLRKHNEPGKWRAHMIFPVI